MANLVRVGGVLLREPGGALARGINCCCIDPPPCPNCCIEITPFGTFNGDGDLIQEFLPETTIKLVMPTKNSRTVCDGENVQVVVTRHNYLESVPPPSGTVYVQWDRSWIYQTHDPLAVGTDGKFFESGLVEWGTMTPPVETFSVTLQFDKCWSDNATQFGDIEAGIRGGDFALIYGTSCDSTACCDPVYPCDNCCWYIDPANNDSTSYELNSNGDPVFWAQNVDTGDRIQVIVDGTNNGVYCVGDTVTLRINLIPNEYTGATWYPKVTVAATANWKRIAHDPPIGNGTVVDGPDLPMSIAWGSNVGATEYEASMEVACPLGAEATISVSFADKYPAGVGSGAGVSFEWICCSAKNPDFSCDDCYPVPEKICCSIGWNGHSVLDATALQAIRDMVTNGSMLPDDQWKMVFGIMSSASNNDPEYPKEVHLALHFVACGYPTIETPEVDPCEHLLNHVCAMLLALDINSLCNLEFSNTCYTVAATFETDSTWLVGHQYEVIVETLVNEPSDAECDPCPPPP